MIDVSKLKVAAEFVAAKKAFERPDPFMDPTSEKYKALYAECCRAGAAYQKVFTPEVVLALCVGLTELKEQNDG